jgi:putative restriction endonuclease
LQDIDRPRTSDWLIVGEVYSRDELKALIATDDTTINTGVFRPRGTASIWLFVTKNKPADRTQYVDRYLDGILHWQGQTQGRTDDAIIHHQLRGDELVVFYRDRKYEYPGAGFRCLGTFDYLSHSGGHPTNFVLQASELGAMSAPIEHGEEEMSLEAVSLAPLEPAGPTMVKAQTMARRGQGLFRYRVSLIEPRCRVTGVQEPMHLRASHIKPWANCRPVEQLDGNNGLFLAPHIDHLFDRGLITFQDDGSMLTSNSLTRDVLNRWGIVEPIDAKAFSAPQAEYLRFHREVRFDR